MNRSFMHLHLGFDATGLDDLELHHIIVNSWEGGVDTEQACLSLHQKCRSLMVPIVRPVVLHCHACQTLEGQGVRHPLHGDSYS